ncbi:MAG: hypothetical protein AAFP04_03630 [Myxococcota bacterium]
MARSQVIAGRNLQEFFRREVSGAATSLGVDVDGSSEFYVVNLLCDFSRSDMSPTPGKEPLAFIYKRAIEAPPRERMSHLKELGDIALYVSGFFADFVERSLVGIDYYIAMGRSAYESLSDLLVGERSGETFVEIYQALARSFAEWVDVLNQISEQGQLRLASDSELLRLYDRWNRTKSPRLARILSQRGVIPVNAGEAELLQ